MYITLYFIVARLPDFLRSVRDHFLSLDPTSLTVDLLEQHLLAAETSAIAVGAARGTPRPPFFEGCSPSPLAPSYASATAVDVSIPEDVGAASASAKHRSSKGKSGVVVVAAAVVEVAVGVVVGAAVEVVAAVGLLVGVGAVVAVVEAAVGVAAVEAMGLEAVGLELGVSVQGVASVSSSSVGARPRLPSSFTCGRLHTKHRCFSRLDNAWRAEFGDDVKLPRWADLLKSRIAILDFDAILSAMYACLLVLRVTVTAPPSLLFVHLSRSDWLTPPGDQLWRSYRVSSGGVASGGAASGGAASKGAESGGAETGGAEPGGVETGGAEPGGVATEGGKLGGAEPEGVETGGAASEGAESGGAEPQGAASSGGSACASSNVSPKKLREWFCRHTRLRSGASGAGGADPAGAGGPGVATVAGVTGETATTGPGGARTRGTGAAKIGGAEGTGACVSSSPPESSLPEVPEPGSDHARAASPTVSRLLAFAVTDPSFESALVAELLDFAAACRLDYATALVAF
ncbi:unnamed protein product [Closterium sp. NIES-54]